MNLEVLGYLKKNILEFKNKSFETESIDEIVEQLQSFYNNYNIIAVNIGKIPTFRVRKLVDNQEHNTKSSLWAPPTKCVQKIGRSNDIGESVFYAAFDPMTAILEGRINEGDDFSLAIYYLESKKEWDTTTVAISTPKNSVTPVKALDEYSTYLSKFMVEEFTKTVKEGDELFYKKSCAISKILFSLPNKDSIIYPSTQNADRINIAMVEEKAKERMKLKSVLKCKLVKINNNFTADVKIFSIAQYIDGIDTLIYDSIPVDNYLISISFDTWVKKSLSFSQTFNPSNIVTPIEIINDILNKNNI